MGKRIIMAAGITFTISLFLFAFISSEWQEEKEYVHDEAFEQGSEYGFEVGYAVTAESVASEKGYEDKPVSEIEIVFRKDHEKIYQEYLKQETSLFSRYYTDWGKEKAEKYYREGYEDGYAYGYEDGYAEEYNHAFFAGERAGEKAYKTEHGNYLTKREKENNVEDYKKEYQEAYEEGYKEGYTEAAEEAEEAYEKSKYDDHITNEDIENCLNVAMNAAQCED